MSTVADLLKHKISKVSITVCANIRWKYMLWHAARCTDNGHNIKDFNRHAWKFQYISNNFFLSHRSLNLWFDTHWKIVHFEKHWIWDQINIKIPIGHGSNVKFSDTICMQLFEPWKYLFQSIFHQLDMVKCTAYGQFPRYRVMTNNKMTVQIYPIYSGVDVWFIITCIYIWL